MNFELCDLYKLKRKRDLFFVLKVHKEDVKSVLYKYRACIEDGKRLLEKPDEKLKRIQRKILYKLYQIDFPQYVFSGVKGRSAYGNVIFHLESKYVLKLDMTKFFPNTHRDKIYKFFKEKLKMAPDVAKLCTDITTINYIEDRVKVEEEVKLFLEEKKIKNTNHLPSGTPTSQILSYIANSEMFDEIIEYCNKNNLKCSIYVDDIAISSDNEKCYKAEKDIIAIIERHNHHISVNKTKKYGDNQYKKITGFVISPNNELVVPNKTRFKIKNNLKKTNRLKEIDLVHKNRIMGLANFANISKKDAYLGLKKSIKKIDV